MPAELPYSLIEVWIEEMLEVASKYEWANPMLLGTQTDRMLTRMDCKMYKWLYKNEKDKPTRMNCWEGVLMAGHTAGFLDEQYLKKALTYVRGVVKPKGKENDANRIHKVVFVYYLMCNAEKTFKVEGELGKGIPAIKGADNIPRGSVVMFGEGDHVALSTGQRMNIITPKAQKAYGRMLQGHGIIELDAKGCQTGWEKTGVTTIEDKACAGSQFKVDVSWAKLPDIGDLNDIISNNWVQKKPKVVKKKKARKKR
jgi:hypothetical protein